MVSTPFPNPPYDPESEDDENPRAPGFPEPRAAITPDDEDEVDDEDPDPDRFIYEEAYENDEEEEDNN